MQKTCAQCTSAFEVTAEDLSLLDKLSPVIGGAKQNLPPPSLCPDCRLQRRLAWRMDRTLYWRTCDLSGRKTLSIVAPDSPFKAYHREVWYGDKWNALVYGRPYDLSKPFFEQFAALQREVPLLALNVGSGLQNSDYVNQCTNSKNCYLTIEADFNEDSLYSYRIFYSKWCADTLEIFRSELCYECVECDRCYHLQFCENCNQCSDAAFLFDCRGCARCFGCSGLRQKQYCFFNEQLPDAEYEKRMAAIDLSSNTQVQQLQARFEELKRKQARRFLIGERNENVSGNYLYGSKDCADCFELRECRDCRHCQYVRSSKDCMDYFVWGDKAERIYDTQCCGINVQNICCCCDCWEGVHDLLYCHLCVLGTSDCFGCVGLQRAHYCILNKQYTQEEYEQLIPQIIERMKENGEWGAFFPVRNAPYCYNETAAQEYFPLEKAEVERRGWRWRSTPEEMPKVTKIISAAALPDRLADIPDDILNWAIQCSATGRPFRIIKQELDYYRDQHLPIPRFHPDERHRRRMTLRNPRKLWDRQCDNCRKPIATSYAPERPEKVLCEACYLKEVY